MFDTLDDPGEQHISKTKFLQRYNFLLKISLDQWKQDMTSGNFIKKIKK